MSAISKLGGLTLLGPVVVPLVAGSAGYAAYKVNWRDAIKSFLTGPGRKSRILLLLLLLFNRKNLPFVWTYRVFYAIFYHHFIRPAPPMGPNALFKPLVSTTHAPLLEIDYNLHKSNSTYFSDLDISRTHLVSHIMRRSMRLLAHNASNKLVLDPKTQKPVDAPLRILLGAVECSFKREIPAYKTYELWSKVLCWDRKWLYIVTHFMPKGAAKPKEWLDPGFKGYKVRGAHDAAGGWEKKIYSTAISKYVIKIGRLTVHPAITLGASGLLPEREGGWMSGDDQLGLDAGDLSDIDLAKEGEWDWRRVEAQRRDGMKLASLFHGLEALDGTFDGGNNGAVATYTSG